MGLDQEVADAAETAEQGEKARLLARAGVPAKFADATLTDGYCRAYVDSFVKDETSTGLYVHGPVGTGKTYNAAGIVKAAAACHSGMATFAQAGVTNKN